MTVHTDVFESLDLMQTAATELLLCTPMSFESLNLMQTAATEPYRKHSLLQFVDVNLTRHALHENVRYFT